MNSFTFTKYISVLLNMFKYIYHSKRVFLEVIYCIIKFFIPFSFACNIFIKYHYMLSKHKIASCGLRYGRTQFLYNSQFMYLRSPMCLTAEAHWRCTGGRSANCSPRPAVCPPAAFWSHDGRPVKETRKSWNKNNETRSIGVWCSAKFSLGTSTLHREERLQEISLVATKFICLLW